MQPHQGGDRRCQGCEAAVKTAVKASGLNGHVVSVSVVLSRGARRYNNTFSFSALAKAVYHVTRTTI
eukprot:3994627-Pyramimonas_sp.AAC.1